jgi:GAF domain-containing protein
MDVLRRYLTIQFPYPDLLSQRRADSLARLGLIGLLLGASLIGLVLVLILQGADTDPTTLAMIPFAILGSFLAIFLANRGWLAAGSWVYVGLTLAAAFGLASVNGLFSESAMVLAAPLFVAGLLFDRRSIVALTVLEIVGVLVLAGSLAGSETAASDLLLRRVPPIAILVAFFGAAQWLLVNQFYASLSQVEAARQQLKAVTALARTLNRPGQEDRIIQAFCQSIQHDFDLYQVLLYLRDPDSPGTFHPRGASGMAAQRLVLEGHSVSLAADLPLTQAVKERSPIVARSTDLANMRAGFLPGTNIQLIQPVIYGDQIVGMLDLQSTDPLAFDEQMIETLGGLARQLGMALHNAVLSVDMQRAQTELEQFNVHMERSAAEIQRLRRQAAGIVWERFFRERHKDILGFDQTPGAETPIPGEDITPTMAEVLQTGQVAVTPTPEGHVLGLPVILRGQVLGAMEFTLKRQGDVPERLVDLATTVAERLSLALDNARLVEQTQALASREQQIGRVSSRLQTARSMEALLNVAAEEFNQAVGSTLTHIRLQLSEEQTETKPTPRLERGGGAT